MTLPNRIIPDDAKPPLPGFDIQELNAKYWHLCCHACRRGFYLPRDPQRRTKDALNILTAHTAGHSPITRQHEDVVDQTPPNQMPICRVCGVHCRQFRCVAYVGAPGGGVPVHEHCLAEFFRRLDDRARTASRAISKGDDDETEIQG
jgi:hypothetical protein